MVGGGEKEGRVSGYRFKYDRGEKGGWERVSNSESDKIRARKKIRC